MEERENNLAMMRAVLDLASDLGVNLVKVFAAWPGLINDEEAIAMYAPYERGNHYRRLYPPDLRRWHRAVDGIREVADWAADMGITLALQNHAPVITPGYEDVARDDAGDRPAEREALPGRAISSTTARATTTFARPSSGAASTSCTRTTAPGTSVKPATAKSCRTPRRRSAA